MKIVQFRDLKVWRLGKEIVLHHQAVSTRRVLQLDHETRMLRNLIEKLSS
jgi:hypothetical protein